MSQEYLKLRINVGNDCQHSFVSDAETGRPLPITGLVISHDMKHGSVATITIPLNMHVVEGPRGAKTC